MHLDIQYTVKWKSDSHFTFLTEFYSFLIITIHHSFPRIYHIQLRVSDDTKHQKPIPYMHSFPDNTFQDSGHKILPVGNKPTPMLMLQALITADEYGSSHVSHHAIQTQTRQL